MECDYNLYIHSADCGIPSTPVNGEIYNFCNNGTVEGSVVIFICNASLEQSFTTVVCNHQGNWQPNVEDICSDTGNDSILNIYTCLNFQIIYIGAAPTRNDTVIIFVFSSVSGLLLAGILFFFIFGVLCGRWTKNIKYPAEIAQNHQEECLELKQNMAYGEIKLTA